MDEAGEKNIDVSHGFQSDYGNSKLTVTAAGKTISHQITNTGKTVGEPNRNWVIDNYRSNHLGKIYFPATGFYDIE